jgi:myo-inositol-1(or 4)-monophosphatase
MNSLPDETVTQAAIAAARAAGALARDAFIAAENGHFSAVEEKGGYSDIVTAADRQAEAIITAIIFEQVPASRILGEEGGWQGDGGVTWYVDPIDGTSNFASGLPIFCVSIAAFADDGRPICGVVYDPMKDELFLASQGQLTLNGKPVTPPRRGTQDRDAELLTNLPREGTRPEIGELNRFADLIANFRAVRRLGSCALQLAYVAVGRAAIGYDERCYPWDIAAGMQLVLAGKGQVLAWDNNDSPIATPLQNLQSIERFVIASEHFDVASSMAVRSLQLRTG